MPGTSKLGVMLFSLVLAAALAGCGGGGDEAPPIDVAQQAYDLRLHGDPDGAFEMLMEAVSDRSAGAAEYYELARTRYHMALGDPVQLKAAPEKIIESAARARHLDPGNLAYACFHGRALFLHGFTNMRSNREIALHAFEAMCKDYEEVLDRAPERVCARLYLVELYAQLPPDLGGDRQRAEKHARELEARDPVLGAQARALLLPEDADEVAFWQGIVADHPESWRAMRELGWSHLRRYEIEPGVARLEEALAHDPESDLLILDIGRYFLAAVWSDLLPREEALPLAEKYVRHYLTTDPPAPLRAYALGFLAKIVLAQDDPAAAEQLLGEAETLDPYYSRSSSVPPPELFVPPDEVYEEHVHRYLFRPF